MDTKKSKKRLSRGKRVFIYTVSVIFTSFLLSLLLMFLANDTFSLTAAAGTTEIVISDDTGIYGASKVLKDTGIIDSRLWFTLYSGLRGKNDTVKAGSYKISNTGGYDGILNTFKSNGVD